MVVWVFAGGGEAEVAGIMPFLQKHLGNCHFERKTPVRYKPGPKPPKMSAYGKTGKSLCSQISYHLKNAIRQGNCDLIFVLDDLDCHDPIVREQAFLQTINTVLADRTSPILVGFAAPELEAWLIADWEHTFARDIDFRQHHAAMQHWLSTAGNVPFDAPETFSQHDPAKDACQTKLSDILSASAKLKAGENYSKAIHTPRLLQLLDVNIVIKKCPQFKRFYVELAKSCQHATVSPS